MAEELAGGGVDDADVEVVDEEQDGGAGEGSADAAGVQDAGSAEGDAGAVDVALGELLVCRRRYSGERASAAGLRRHSSLHSTLIRAAWACA